MEIGSDLLAQINHHLWAAEDGLKKGNLQKVENQLGRARDKLPRVDFLCNVVTPWSGRSGPMPITIVAMMPDGTTINQGYTGTVVATVDPIQTGPVPIQLMDANRQLVAHASGFQAGRWRGFLLLQPNLTGIYPPILRIKMKDTSADLLGDTAVQWTE